jgi:hypothetical protein
MANQLVRSLVGELPWAMRDSVEGYVDAVAAALPELERESGGKLPRQRVDEFLFIVAVRRIWDAVNAQYWIIDNSVTIARRRDLAGFQAGRDKFSKDSDAFAESRELRDQLVELMRRLEIESLVTDYSLADVLRDMRRE